MNGQVIVSDDGAATAKATVAETTLANDTYTVVGEEHYAIDSDEYGLINSKGELVAVSDDGKAWKSAIDNTKTVLTTE